MHLEGRVCDTRMCIAGRTSIMRIRLDTIDCRLSSRVTEIFRKRESIFGGRESRNWGAHEPRKETGREVR
ncbi:hypothetical protein RSAG8_11940, partial [Rhizoctonia solani AG-8 WAC10335]